jgi:hypothetical protein
MYFSVSSGAPFFGMPVFAPQFDIQAGTLPCQFLANRGLCGRRFLTGMLNETALSCLCELSNQIEECERYNTGGMWSEGGASFFAFF